MAESKRQPRGRENSRGDEADVTAPLTPALRGPKPPPMFVQDKDRWTELRRRCADKEQLSQARNSVQGLKLQAKTVADFKICKTWESLRKYQLTRSRKTLLPKPSGSVGAPNTEPIPKTLDLVLVSGTAEANDKRD
ncbi:hypothetical protein EVAR_78601_1 [Eumeta japonica]|uniref:Uncharacterized protein n=1 Tax=Eumeta variegata TaxID=151549 RepID=A0A4C1U7R5_EUMVA|nr:hypothetical protein EVAR_78601_1 [Eumeta japonica]